MRRRVTIVCVLVGAVVGCGGDSEPVGPAPRSVEGDPMERLLAHLPAPETGFVAYVDLAAARRELGLPTDADPSEDSKSDAMRRLQAAAGVTALNRLLSPSPNSDIAFAIDHGRITAAAASDLAGTTVLATDQPADEIAERLSTRGWSETDGAFSRPGQPTVLVDDRVVVLGRDQQAVRAAAARTSAAREIDAAGQLLGTLSGPARSLGSVHSARGKACVAFAVAADHLDGTGELLLALKQPGSARRVSLDPGTVGLSHRATDIEVRDKTVHMRVEPKREPAPPVSPISFLAGDVVDEALYRCG